MVAMEHRPDIDGLRAIAVLAVVFYHAELWPFSGGYVGVDVFFVISGYLITGIITREVNRGSFSLASFYERRIRRLFPALFAMLAFCVVAAHALFLTTEYREFGKSVISALLFSSNVFFWNLGLEYFETPAEVQPLLHTWSLATEEQFYLLFPVFLFVLSRIRIPWIWGVAAALIVSFSVGVWGVRNYPEAAYYLLPSRAWELMIGAALALYSGDPPRSVVGRSVICAMGLGLIGYAVIGFTDATTFPGYMAAVPCVGTALVIYTGTSGSAANRLLSWRPLVIVGLASYSLYLWHWPILVFGKYALLGSITPWHVAALLALSLAVSLVSWRYIEEPFRRKRLVKSREGAFASAAAGTFVLGVVGLGVANTSGRVPDQLEILTRVETHQHQYRDCHNPTVAQIRGGEVCVLGVRDTDPRVALWGDSHAEHHIEAVALAAEREDMSVMVLTAGGCAPLVGVEMARGGGDCRERARASADLIHRTESIDTVILSAYWKVFATGHSYRHDGRYLVDAHSDGVSSRETAGAFTRGLERTLRELSGYRVWIMEDVPILGFDVPRRYVRMKSMGLDPDSESMSRTLQEYRANQAPATTIFRSLQSRFDFDMGEVADVLCPDGVCSGSRGEKIL
jgi:peptidoglycan/LPS O-acetylase OafA/YrhL